MTKEEMIALIGKSGITVQGDLVLEKHVENEVGNVENGGIGVQKVYKNGEEEECSDSRQDASDSGKSGQTNQEGDEELFHFIHPSVSDSEELQIHNEVKRLVGRFGIQDICKYLMQLKKENKILLPQSPAAAYQELVRMGMPSGEGFAEKTFQKYYNKP